ncbi:MAG TPA: hypothetical protein VHH73_20985 [Verrucomicrobiae bacterium]|nr:hypothetical protein [Verrucomicrobiae bacterium]
MDATLPSHWSPRRWITAIGLLIAVHVAVPMMLRGPATQMARETTGLTIRASGINPGRPVSETERWNDPTLLALPHLNDFSGPAWLRPKPLNYQFNDWSEPARWLAADPARLGMVDRDLPVANSARLPELVNVRPETSVPATAGLKLPGGSTLRIEGGLVPSDLAEPLELPDLTATNLMTNSVVQVLVNAGGQVLTARLLAAPTSRTVDQIAADARALDLARTAQFTPAPGPATKPRSGRLIFRWATRPAASGEAGTK